MFLSSQQQLMVPKFNLKSSSCLLLLKTQQQKNPTAKKGDEKELLRLKIYFIFLINPFPVTVKIF